MYALAEQNNVLRLLRSLTSATCPICGRAKIERTALCVPCKEKLPAHMAVRFEAVKFTDLGYPALLELAFKAVEAKVFIDPQPALRCQRFSTAPENFTVARLGRSQKSRLCPACGASKESGKRLCAGCNWLLERLYKADLANAGTECNGDWIMFKTSMEPPACNVDPMTFTANFRAAMARIGANTMYVTP